MKILITGANSYIGTKLLPILIENGHEIVCLVKNKKCFYNRNNVIDKITVIEGDLFKPSSLSNIPDDIEATYFFVNKTDAFLQEFCRLDELNAKNLLLKLNHTNCQQIIHVGQTYPFSTNKRLESILKSGPIPSTILRTGIVVGKDSPSFSFIQNLTNKTPVLVAPKWLNHHCKPIDIRNVLEYLVAVLHNGKALNREFNLTGPEIISYKQLIAEYAKAHGLKRWIIDQPLNLTTLSSLGLAFINSTTFKEAKSLVQNIIGSEPVTGEDIKNFINLHLYNLSESLGLPASLSPSGLIV
ncbi:NAD-dependent epimerase/dehydratase family protein [Solitalea sp. MAHUQ-68]|uniref:NAD-dependent epimerase/dehydratase family protein n=1 Tax=Solitalea agri TaxID=2953739 RepID=A0A9X2FBH5_9SPHI|nr:NAD-dependent epimerase/dehydratase family protein [Solitalea agri]MCO4293848.1 NAD-dependent epimerase/dehydratase family protein [Solitalea agri]